MKNLLVLFTCIVLTTQSLKAQIRMPAIFCDHMVLEQKSEVAVWGWAWPSAPLTITTSWDKDQIVDFKAANNTFFKTTIKTPKAGGPFVITIKSGDKNQVVIKDVVIGEVWICSGQSNMEWNVGQAADAKEDAAKTNLPNIRFFQVNKSSADFPQVHGEGQWQLCTNETMQNFSAVGYYFGKKISTDLKVPIGLINASWAGTPAEVWTPKDKIENDAALKSSSEKLTTNADGWPKESGIVYNSMIKPLAPYAIAGAIWYQGEGNTANSETYAKLMQTMIESWRADFRKDFSFYYVQIAPYTYERKYEGALIREQQSKILALVPKTGMVIISDAVDDIKDIHPKFKKPVGERLASLALAETYKMGVLGAQSPVYKSMAIDHNKIKISFDYAQIGLISHNGEPTQFTIAGEDKKFYPAIAKIDGSVVIVSAKEVKAPVAVRFCWDNTSIPNLFNKEGLPVSIFRTDDWALDMTPDK